MKNDVKMPDAAIDDSSASRAETVSPPTRRSRYARAAAPEHPLTGMKLEALRLIAESQFLSTPQVASLLGVSERAARSHLRDLFDMSLVEVIPVPRAALKMGEADPLSLTFGSAPKIHRATKKGLDTLVQSRLLDSTSAIRPPAYGPENAAFLGHELAVRDTLIWLTRSARTNENHGVERWECGVGLSAGGVRPDAVFVYDFGLQCVAGVVEADMGTERGANRWWAAKFSSYAALFAEESRQALWNLTGYKRARIVITVPTPARAVWMARQAMEQGEGTFVPSQTWIAVRSRLVGADVYAPIWLRPNGEESGFLPPPDARDKGK